MPSSRIRPSVGCSNPAIIRRVVVFPQPDGPSREKNSPGSTSRSMWSTAVTSANRLVRPMRRISPRAISPQMSPTLQAPMSFTTDCPACRSPRVKARQTRKPSVTDASESSIMIVAMAFVDGSGAARVAL